MRSISKITFYQLQGVSYMKHAKRKEKNLNGESIQRLFC